MLFACLLIYWKVKINFYNSFYNNSCNAIYNTFYIYIIIYYLNQIYKQKVLKNITAKL